MVSAVDAVPVPAWNPAVTPADAPAAKVCCSISQVAGSATGHWKLAAIWPPMAVTWSGTGMAPELKPCIVWFTWAIPPDSPATPSAVCRAPAAS